jgi:toxin HigB-1
VEVQFKTKKLKKQYENHRDAEKAYGREVARKYIGRIDIIRETKNLDELQTLPGLRCHALEGNLKGLWAVNLTGFYRLLFRLKGETLNIVCIEKVSKHYED